MNSNQKSLGGATPLRDKNVIVKLLLWCSLSVFIGLSAISQGGVTRFIPGILVSTTILFYLIVIRANSVTYSSLKQFNTKTGVLSIASSAGTLCCVADTIYHMVMKSGAISKLMSKGISTTTIQAVVVIALLTMSFIAMYGVSVIFNYILSNVVALIDTIIDNKYRTKEAYGRYRNVFLEDYSELEMEIAELDTLIEDLSAYMQSTGRKYADHAATLRSWSARKKKQQKPGTGIPDYTYNEEESL